MPMTPYRLIGANASPYSVKMRAVMRYRRLPFIWELRDARHAEMLSSISPPTIPFLVCPDGKIRNDSTLLIQHLEEECPSGRSLYTGDPTTDFLSHLIEDFADEWLTRVMAWFRWNHEEDRSFVGNWVAEDHNFAAGLARREEEARLFRKRQTGRRLLLGAARENGDLLDHTYRALLSLLTELLADQEYLFGSRPVLADFGLFGQLWQMSIDPTAGAIMRRWSPEVLTWLLRLDDASGCEGKEKDPREPIHTAVGSLLEMVGKTHLPLLRANALAIDAGESVCRFEVDGMSFVQSVSKYHVKCLTWLREEYDRLEPSARERADAALSAAGCGSFFAEAS